MKPPDEKAGGTFAAADLETLSAANLAANPAPFKPGLVAPALSRAGLAERACRRWALNILAVAEDLQALRCARRAKR